MHRYTRAAACLVLLAGLFALFLPTRSSIAMADDGIVQVPDGGRLEAVDEQGNVLGPCPLKHTDVNATISGPFSRVVVKQTYTNPYPQKIEAVYTFPLSARGAVDRMTMTVGERVVVGEVKERQKARQIYEQARESGYVASLLEQERPNILTQSIANIEPGATVEVEIAYVEMLQSRDGEYSFDFPMVVGPRYIPGYKQPLPGGLPEGFAARRGVVLLGPATVTINDAPPVPGDDAKPAAAALSAPEVDSMLRRATAIATPSPAWWENARSGKVSRTAAFTVAYADGSKEIGELYNDRSGQLNGRWFFCPPIAKGDQGTGFSPDTNQVPDASKITPMPVRPPNRAGHDISVTVNIDSGGAPITDVKSELHEISRDGRPAGAMALDGIGGRRTTIALRNQKEIPNRDFILKWRTAANDVQEGVFTHVDERNGGFVTVVLDPPARGQATIIRPRELVFVLDTSGSMSGFPIEKAKEVMSRAIDAMRPQDTFNLITFAGNTAILWPEPRPATPQNRAEAQQFLASRQGGGGTEMMKAIEAALKPTGGPAAGLDAMGLANLPADGRAVTVVVPMKEIGQYADRMKIKASETILIPLSMSIDLPTVVNPEGVKIRLAGDWTTVNGERQLRVREAGFIDRSANAPMRIVMFLTDGYVGNDQAIVQAVRDNAGTTRVFSFGIGNSVNRFLLEQMSLAGRGAVEFVTLAEGADKAVERFARRIQNPVLTDIAIGTAGFELSDIVAGSPSTAPGVLLPDLYDDSPIMFHARVKTPGKGQLVVSGKTGAGPWEKRIDVDVSKPNATAGTNNSGAPALPVLWARSKVESVLAPHLQALEQQTLDAAVRKEVIALGERFGISTPFTSFVAVEKSRMTLGGKPMLVAVPVELPQGTRFEGFFGDALRKPGDQRAWRESMLSAVSDPTAAVQYLYLTQAVDFSGAPSFDLAEALAEGRSRGGGIAFVGDTPEVDSIIITTNAAPAAVLADVLKASKESGAKTDAEQRRQGVQGVADKKEASPASAAIVPPPAAKPAAPDTGAPSVARPGAPLAVAAAADPAEKAKEAVPQHLSKIPTSSVYFSRMREAEADPAAAGGGVAGPRPGAAGGGPGGPNRDVGNFVPPMRAGKPGAPAPTLPAPGANLAVVVSPSSGAVPAPSAAPASPPPPPRPAPMVPAGKIELAGEHRAASRLNTAAFKVLTDANGNPLIATGGAGGGGGFGGGGTGGAGGAGGGIFGNPGEPALRYWRRGEDLVAPWSAQSSDTAADRAEQLREVVTEVVRPEHWTEMGGTLASSVVLEDKIAYIAAVDSEEARKLVADATLVQETLLKALEPTGTATDGAAAPRAIPMPAIARSLVDTTVDGAPARVATLVIYDIADLVASREGVASPEQSGRVARLVDVTQEMIAPDTWMNVGGNEASVRAISSLFVITAPAETHVGVQALLDAMRRVTSPGAGPAARVELDAPTLGNIQVFDVSALTKGDLDAAKRIESIVELVEPGSWLNNGGDAGHDMVVNGVLVVRHTSPDVRRRVALLVDQLHAAVGVALPAERKQAVDKAQSMSSPTPPSEPASSVPSAPSSAIVVHDINDIATKIASEGAIPPPFGTAVASTRLAELIPQNVLPAAWERDGATFGQAVALGGVVVVDQQSRVQIAIDTALNTLRATLGLPPKPLALAPALAPQVAEVQAQLAEEPKALEARIERINTLFARLDGPLFARVVEIEDPKAKLVDRSRLESPAATGDESFAVNVLVDEPTPAIIEAVRSAGLSIESRNDRMKILIGWLPPTKLAEVALTNGVRRIEQVGDGN